MAAIGYQFRLLHEHFPGQPILEVGAGTSLTAHLLRQIGYSVTTLDVDARLHPDIVASITEIPRKDGSFGAFGCYQVLEHLPWKLVPRALGELRRIAEKGGVVSVPTRKPAFAVFLYNRWFSGGGRYFPLPYIRRPLMLDAQQHRWELGVNVKPSQFRNLLHDAGFKIQHELRPPYFLYHPFFVLTTR